MSFAKQGAFTLCFIIVYHLLDNEMKIIATAVAVRPGTRDSMLHILERSKTFFSRVLMSKGAVFIHPLTGFFCFNADRFYFFHIS